MSITSTASPFGDLTTGGTVDLSCTIESPDIEKGWGQKLWILTC